MNQEADNAHPLHWRPIDDLLGPQARQRQTLPGFDSEFTDIVDYIIKITHRIWEQKNVGLINDYYADPCPVHTLGNLSTRVADVVKGTLNTIAAYPDRALIGENVVWSEEPDGSFYSSHRITSTMTHTGPSEFGPSTGRAGRVTTIADCVCRENRVVYEWLMRDNSFLALQFGLDPVAIGRGMAATRPADGFEDWWQETYRAARGADAEREAPAPGTDLSAEEFSESWLQTLFNRRLFGAIPSFYAPNARVEWPGGRHTVGPRGISGIFIQWLAQLEESRARIDHVAARPFDESTADVAIRWTLAGKSNLAGPVLAACKGLPLLVLGATHLRVRAGKITDEWTVFDEIALFANLFRAAGSDR